MILLATITGLRTIDVVKLQLNSIDWLNGEIRLVQEKTGKALALPLTTDVGKALCDYILNARPNSKASNVFLSTKVPYGELANCSPGMRLRKYRVDAGFPPEIGFHSLRRSIATNMITSGVPITTLVQTLGQTNIESARPYIALDSKNLKECALDFTGIEIGGVI
jgi:integrase